MFVTSWDGEPESLRRQLQENGFTLDEKPYTHFIAQKPGVSLALYKSGKMVVQGKASKEFIEFFLEPEVLKNTSYTEKQHILDFSPHMGSDEAGKGDFFGPLVIATAYVDEKTLPRLKELNVRDSKNISDPSIRKMAQEIVKIVPYEVVSISPARYNELYLQFQNLNSLLAWGHATAIEALYKKTGCREVLVDKFANEYVLESALAKKKCDLNLSQKTKGESDTAVATASILARAAFVYAIDKLKERWGLTFPKGASAAVTAAGRQFVSQHGQGALDQVAKIHFSTFFEVCAKCSNDS